MKFLVALLLLVAPVVMRAQAGHFSSEAGRAKGDLNKDGIDDVAIVTLDNKGAYLLQIFFGQADGGRRLMISTAKAIEPKSSNGMGAEFDEVRITSGVLTISAQLLRGHYEHKFRYQNGHFELIGFSEGSSDGQGTIETIDFNLSTGIRIETKERADTDKVLSNKKKKVLIRPLPRLENFVPFEGNCTEDCSVLYVVVRVPRIVNAHIRT